MGSGGFQRSLEGHDAFRRRTGSLHLAYPLLSLLDQQPVPLTDLAGWLQMPESQASRLLGALVRAGVARVSAQGAARAEGPLESALNRFARAVGTHGARRHAIEAYKQNCRKWRESQETWAGQRHTVGSTLWLAEESKGLREQLSADHRRDLRKVWLADGSTLEDLMATVLRQREEAESRPVDFAGFLPA